MTKTYEQQVAEAQARMDAYANSDETKARHARTAANLRDLFPNGGHDSSGNSIGTIINALDRASK